MGAEYRFRPGVTRVRLCCHPQPTLVYNSLCVSASIPTPRALHSPNLDPHLSSSPAINNNVDISTLSNTVLSSINSLPNDKILDRSK